MTSNLINQFKQLNIKCNLNKRPNGNYRLKLYALSSVQNFFNYIGSCDILGFQYKWKIPELCKNSLNC